MPETEIMTYERISKTPEKKRRIIDKKVILRRFAGFLAAAASPYFGIAPFGLSFLTLERKLSVRAFISLGFVAAGGLLTGDKLMTVKYAAAAFLYMLTLFVLEKGVVLSKRAAPIVMSAALAVVSAAIGYVRGISISEVLTFIYETAGIFAGAYAMDRVRGLIDEKRLLAKNISGEEKFCLIIVCAIMFLSLKSFDFFSEFKVSNAVAAFLILSAARSCGFAASAAVGIGIGMLCGIETDYFLPFMGAFGFCALTAGTVAKKGKIWAIFAMAIADAIVIVYVNGAIRNILTVYEIMAASAAFALVPDKVYGRLGRLFKMKNSEAELIKRIKGGLIMRLRSVSASFSALGETLTKLSERESGANPGDLVTVFDRTADKVCRRCKKSDICWGKDFNATYRNFFGMLEILENKGSIEESEVNEYFGAKCANVPRVTAELNNQFTIYRINNAWRKRMGESREAVGEQIAGVSKIINELAREINEDINYDSAAAAEIRLRIESKGVKIKDINVIKNRDGKARIEMSVRGSDWTSRGRGVIRSVTGSIMGKEVNISKIREDGEFIMIMIDESERYEIEQGYASVGASEENGDNFRCIMPGGGKFVITLSDGMGTGKRAASESQAIIELLDSFLRAGFDKHVAVRLINSIMVLKSANETFATLDMCIIDLHSGEVEFIKTGAEPSFIKQGGKVETVRAASLPVGLMPEMEVETFARRVKEGDTIVMVTDGVETKEGGNKWIKGFMETVKPTSANDLAARLLDRAIEENHGAVSDDMTVISLRIRKKSA